MIWYKKKTHAYKFTKLTRLCSMPSQTDCDLSNWPQMDCERKWTVGMRFLFFAKSCRTVRGFPALQTTIRYKLINMCNKKIITKQKLQLHFLKTKKKLKGVTFKDLSCVGVVFPFNHIAHISTTNNHKLCIYGCEITQIYVSLVKYAGFMSFKFLLDLEWLGYSTYHW